MPLVISQALERLYFPKWNPREISEYKTDTIEKEKYVIEFASEREEGREEGREEERQKHEEEKRSIARGMLQEGMDIQKVSKITGLSVEEVQALL
jgi:predicted transposase/invertase (TIGR01784 family)